MSVLAVDVYRLKDKHVETLYKSLPSSFALSSRYKMFQKPLFPPHK